MRTQDNVNYTCDEGKVFRRKEDGIIMGNGLSLGKEDSIENYEEVDNPEAEKKEAERPTKRKRGK